MIDLSLVFLLARCISGGIYVIISVILIGFIQSGYYCCGITRYNQNKLFTMIYFIIIDKYITIRIGQTSIFVFICNKIDLHLIWMKF